MSDASASATLDPYSRNLGRGKACAACRRRKLRCDGGRPSCNRCLDAQTRRLDAMRRRGRSEADIAAVRFPPCYTEGDEMVGEDMEPAERRHDASTQATRSTSTSGATTATTVGTTRSSSGPVTPEDCRPMKVQRIDGPSAHAESSSRRSPRQDTSQNDLFFAEILSSQLPLETSSRAASNDPFAHNASQPLAALVQNGVKVPQDQSKSISTAYWLCDTDVDLPAAPLLNRLIDSLFEEYAFAYIFHPQRLRERIALGPQHPRYPAAALLHTIVALVYAARPDMDEEMSGEPPTSRSGAHYRHFCAAQQALMFAIHSGRSLHAIGNSSDIVRASLLLVFKLFGQGDELESYLTGAQAARLCIAININRDIPTRAEQELAHLQFLLMQPRIPDASIIRPEPSDEIEAEELRRTMSLAFIVDRTGMVATLWPGSLAEEDYTAEMPRATLEEFLATTTANVRSQPWTQRRNPVSLQSPDYFSRRATDSEQLFFKVSILLGRCALYISRLSRTATPDRIVSASRFQQLESWIAAMHLESYELANMIAARSSPTSTTGSHFAPRNSDGSLAAFLLSSGSHDLRKGLLVTASLVPYACTLTLHEPLASLDHESDARCKAATRGAINVLRLCAGHAEEQTQQLNVLMTIIVMLVGRSLIRQLESLYSKYIAQEMTQQSEDSGQGAVQQQASASTAGSGTGSVWNSDEFNESVSLLQADLEVVLLTLKRFGQRWVVAIKMHDSLLKMLQFNPEHRLRGLFCVE